MTIKRTIFGHPSEARPFPDLMWGQETPGPSASWSANLVAAAQRLQGSYTHERELYQYKHTINS